MSRAEMFLAWCSDFFSEVADFLSHYFRGGYDLWGHAGIGFLFVVVGMGALATYDLYEPDTNDESQFTRIRDAVGGALILAPIYAVLLWFPLNVLLGYLFGPVRP